MEMDSIQALRPISGKAGKKGEHGWRSYPVLRGANGGRPDAKLLYSGTARGLTLEHTSREAKYFI